MADFYYDAAVSAKQQQLMMMIAIIAVSVLLCIAIIFRFEINHKKIINAHDKLEDKIHQRTIELIEQKENLKKAVVFAEKASLAKSEFLSSMSHELRTPLNAIIGFSHLLSYDEAINEEQLENITEISKAGDHLLSLINEILDLANIEAKNIQLSFEDVCINDAINDCINLTNGLAVKRGIKIQFDFDHINVESDLKRVKQVIINLLSNAIKYNVENGHIYISSKLKDQATVLIKVRDTGHGIPAEYQHELFQPFHRLDAKTSNVEGTGIGLNITKKLVLVLGGSIGVESEVGEGSTFWVEIPLKTIVIS